MTSQWMADVFRLWISLVIHNSTTPSGLDMSDAEVQVRLIVKPIASSDETTMEEEDSNKKRVADDQDNQLERTEARPANALEEGRPTPSSKNFDDDFMKRRRVDGDDNEEKQQLPTAPFLETTQQNTATTILNAATIPTEAFSMNSTCDKRRLNSFVVVQPMFNIYTAVIDQSAFTTEASDSLAISLSNQQESQSASSTPAAPSQQQQMMLMYDANGQLVAVPNPFSSIATSAVSSGYPFPNIFSGTSSSLTPAQQAAALAAVQQQFWAQAAASISASANAAAAAAASAQHAAASAQPLSPPPPTSASDVNQNLSSQLSNATQAFQLSTSLLQLQSQLSTALQSQQQASLPSPASSAQTPSQVSTADNHVPMNAIPPPAPSVTTSTQPSQHSGVTGRAPATLYLTCDDDSLSDYQCLVRKQIELFEAKEDDVESNAQGRNKPIVIGQVGIRCRHCATLPPRNRARGATYYPAKLDGLYQAAQNMASSHLCSHCQLIPPATRQELMVLRDRKSSAGGGKKYWADGVRALGVYEDADVLRFERR